MVETTEGVRLVGFGNQAIRIGQQVFISAVEDEIPVFSVESV
jgi:hypothetical protein